MVLLIKDFIEHNCWKECNETLGTVDSNRFIDERNEKNLVASIKYSQRIALFNYLCENLHATL